jgi:hypothetical protein
MIKKASFFAAVTILGVGICAPTFAGEQRGNGGATPIGTYVVIAAICAFSGLEDVNPSPGDTQTPHEEGGNVAPAGVASICQFLNPGKNPKTPPPPPAE